MSEAKQTKLSKAKLKKSQRSEAKKAELSEAKRLSEEKNAERSAKHIRSRAEKMGKLC